MKTYRICRLRCRQCGDILEYANHSKTDNGPGNVMICRCGRIGLDPSATLYRALSFPPGTLADVDDLSEEWED